MLLLPEVQNTDVWEPSKNSAISEIGMKCKAKYFHLIFLSVNIISAPCEVWSYRSVVRFQIPSYAESDFSL